MELSKRLIELLRLDIIKKNKTIKELNMFGNLLLEILIV